MMRIIINSRMLLERIQGLTGTVSSSLAVAVVSVGRWRGKGKVSRVGRRVGVGGVVLDGREVGHGHRDGVQHLGAQVGRVRGEGEGAVGVVVVPLIT